MILTTCKTCNRLLSIVREDDWVVNEFHFDTLKMWQNHISLKYHGKKDPYKAEAFIRVPSLKHIHWATVKRRTNG